jgi:hypothetical protein
MSTLIGTATALYLQYSEPATVAISAGRPTISVVPARKALVDGGTVVASSFDKQSATIGKESEQPFIRLSLADQAVAQLLKMETWLDDWDGAGAAKPVADTLHEARSFIRLLAPESVIPRPALHADGKAMLFLRGPDSYAELEFLGESKIDCYARQGEREWADEISLQELKLPELLSQIGFVV